MTSVNGNGSFGGSEWLYCSAGFNRCERGSKAAIMLEHFMSITRHKMGGREKAMVVTPSRLHAVRYVQEFRRQIAEKGYNDLEVLVLRNSRNVKKFLQHWTLNTSYLIQ